MCERSSLQRFAEHAQDDSEGVAGSLRDLREAIGDYQLCSLPWPPLDVGKDTRWYNKRQSMLMGGWGARSNDPVCPRSISIRYSEGQAFLHLPSGATHSGSLSRAGEVNRVMGSHRQLCLRELHKHTGMACECALPEISGWIFVLVGSPVGWVQSGGVRTQTRTTDFRSVTPNLTVYMSLRTSLNGSRSALKGISEE